MNIFIWKIGKKFLLGDGKSGRKGIKEAKDTVSSEHNGRIGRIIRYHNIEMAKWEGSFQKKEIHSMSSSIAGKWGKSIKRRRLWYHFFRNDVYSKRKVFWRRKRYHFYAEMAVEMKRGEKCGIIFMCVSSYKCAWRRDKPTDMPLCGK